MSIFYPPSGFAPLENAICNTPDPAIIKALLDAGARIPSYALYGAIKRDGHEREILQMLIEAGVEKPELVTMLMQAGADPWHED